MGDDGFLNIRLPDAHHGHAVFRDARGVNQACMNRKCTGGGGQIATITRPIHKGLVNRDLTVEIIHIVIRHAGFGQNHAFGRAGSRATHAVNVRGVWVGAANHAHEQLVARRAGLLAGFRQILQTEKHAFGCAATNVGGGDFNLCGKSGHDDLREIMMRYSSPNRLRLTYNGKICPSHLKPVEVH